MTFRDFQRQARRTQNEELSSREQLEHAICGIASEFGEVCGIYQKQFQGHKIDYSKLRVEIGDLLWFIAELCDVYDFDMGFIAEGNIDKLRKRYPEGFSEEQSVHRTV